MPHWPLVLPLLRERNFAWSAEIALVSFAACDCTALPDPASGWIIAPVAIQIATRAILFQRVALFFRLGTAKPAPVFGGLLLTFRACSCFAESVQINHVTHPRPPLPVRPKIPVEKNFNKEVRRSFA